MGQDSQAGQHSQGLICNRKEIEYKDSNIFARSLIYLTRPITLSRYLTMFAKHINSSQLGFECQNLKTCIINHDSQ